MYLIILTALFVVRVFSKAARSRKTLWVLLILLFLFSAFRFRVGCDWFGYYQNYILGPTLDYSSALERREQLWWIIQIAFNQAQWAYPWVNVLTSAIFFIGAGALARQQPDPISFVVLLFPVLIINMPMSGIRQAAAIGFFCFAIIEFTKGRSVRYVAWMLLASTIHASAVAFIVLAPLAGDRVSKTRAGLSLAMAIPALWYLTQRDEAQVAISRYVATGLEAAGAPFRVALLAMTGFYFLLALRKQWMVRYPRDYGIVGIGSCIMLGLLVLLPVSSVIADRFGYYMVPIQTMILARIPYLKVGSARTLQIAAPYIILFAAFAIWSTYSSLFRGCYEPYQSWLFGYPAGVAPLPFE